MKQRERLCTTLGILLAGLIEAEQEAAESERRPRVRNSSGVYRVGEDGLGPTLPVDPAVEPVSPY
jgi:hypothetical protein